MKKLLNYFLLLGITMLLGACSSDEDDIAPVNDHVLKKFAVLKSLNQESILADCEAIVTPGKIALTLDTYDALKSLVVSFEHEGEQVTVGGVKQTSGVTPNDFSKPLVYTVETKNGQKIDYEVSLSFTGGQPILSFDFLKSVNKDLPHDSKCTFEGRSILSFLPVPPTTLVPTFQTTALSVSVDGKEQESGVSAQDFTQPVVYELQMRNGEKLAYTVKTDYMPSEVPHLYIKTANSSYHEIESKDYYVDATIEIDGKNVYENYTGETEIKGRGNSTWSMPKKPYRLKLKKKASLCGFGEAKNYVLLANHIDPTLMLNAVAFKMGQLLDMPFTHHVVPIDVTLNGQYKGSYMLTEQVEVKKHRIDLDEDNCIVWEFDTNYDEDQKFISDVFGLPVMVKDPDLTDEQFKFWKNDLNSFLKKLSQPLEGNDYTDLIDIESVAKYILIYNLTHNMEINHPKSVYMHKEGDGKYVMGPIWDFDWAFDYENNNKHFNRYNVPLWNANMTNGAGTKFFTRFLEDPRVTKLYKEIWADFYATKFDLLLNYVDGYAKIIAPSVEANSRIWSNTKDFESRVRSLRFWLKNRAEFINTEIKDMK